MSQPPSQPAPQYIPAAAPAKKPSKAPRILLIVGGVILALSVIIGVVVAVIGFRGVAADAAQMEIVSGTGTLTAEAGDSYQLYVEQGMPAPMCVVDGPTPEAVGEGVSQSSTVTFQGTAWESFDSFTATEAGEYSVICDGTVAVGRPVSIGGIFTGIGGIFLAIAGGGLGLLLILIGVILLIVRRSATR